MIMLIARVGIATSCLLYVFNPSNAHENQVRCVAQNIYFEARGESLVGQVAVGQVVMNRVYDVRWPSSPCAVVKQRKSRRRCQFSWYCDGKSDRPLNMKSWEQAHMIAKAIYFGDLQDDQTYGAKFYHSLAVSPRWAMHCNITVTIGNHIFYRC